MSIFILNAIGERISLKLWGVVSSELDFSNLEEVKMTHIYTLRLSQAMLGLAFLLTAFISTNVFRKRSLDFVGINRKVYPVLAMAGILTYIAFIPASNWLIVENANLKLPEKWAESFQKLEDQSDQLYAAMLYWNTGIHLYINLLIMALIPAIGEEIIFRGVFLRIFKSWTSNIHWGVVLTSIFFATLHFQPYKFVPMVCISALLCYIFYLTGSLWIPIMIHFFNNALVVLGDHWIKKGTEIELLEDDFTFPIWVTVLSVLITVGLIKLLWDKSKHKMELSFE